MKTLNKILFLFSACTISTSVFSEDLTTILKKVEQFSTEGNYSKALEELSWARKELEDQYLKKLVTLLPDNLNGFTGEKAESNSALGFTTTSRSYKNGANSAKIEITGGAGAGGGAQNGMMGGFAALGQMAALMGQQPGQNTLRINGRTASLKSEEGELTVFLNGGTMLIIKQESGKVELKAMAEALNIDAIEKYLSGNK